MKEKAKKVEEMGNCKKAKIEKSKERGITLIALIVTIIVLLILASVTIATLTGENGIITNAIEARERTEIASVKEQAKLDIASWVTDRLANGEDATVNSASQVKEILETINTNNTNPYYKELQEDKIITPDGYEIPYTELYTTGSSSGSGSEGLEAGEEVSQKPTEWTSEQVTAIADGENGVIPLPDGFYYVGGTKSEGIVISDDPTDEGKGTSHEVAQTLQGNQFVWVPVEEDEDFKTYEGYAGGNLEDMLSECEEPYSGGYATEVEEYNQMKEGVLQYNGFYVGRYETGVEGEERTEDSGIEDEVIIKQGKNVYNYVGWSSSGGMTVGTGGAVELSKNFATERGYTSVTSTLIYGVQWDAIMAWIDPAYKTGSCSTDSFVRDSTGRGNYTEEENVNPWRNSLAATGASANYAVKNIYDLAGNVAEWTMEKIENACGGINRVFRGR